jgi:alanine dehydrogenase
MMARHRILILNDKMVRQSVKVSEAIKAVEEAFRFLGQGKVQMPAKLYLHLDKYSGDFRAMPAYIEGYRSCGIKWVNVHAGNAKRGLPTVMALIILSDPGNGLPLCVMDATYATALRTAAAGAVAAKYLARPDSTKVALVGCGAQARTQLEALNQIFDIGQVNVWGLRIQEAKGFINQMRHLVKSHMTACDTIRDCVREADIVVTTTPSRRPLVKSTWIKQGTHINAIGADAKGKQELDPEILRMARVVVDSCQQASHSGEINVPLSKGLFSRKDIYADIGELVCGKKPGRQSYEEITVFDSTGLAIQDIAIANIIYTKAKRSGKARFVDFL